MKCRNCGTELRPLAIAPNDGKDHPDFNREFDPEYCSGKCRKADGHGVKPEDQVIVDEIMATDRSVLDEIDTNKVIAAMDTVSPEQKTEATVSEPGSFEHYCANPDKYRRRYQPERLNWGEILGPKELKQAGFRNNRRPIPGDWDYEESDGK